MKSLPVDGSLSFSELIEQASHGNRLFNNGLEESKFPIVNKSKRIITVELLAVTGKNRSKVPELIEAGDLRSLHIEELLQYSYKFPNIQSKYNVFTLDCYTYSKEGILYPYLDFCEVFGRRIQLGYPYGVLSNCPTRFAVTEKD